MDTFIVPISGLLFDFFAYLRKYFDCKDTQIFDTKLKLLTKICIRYLNRTFYVFF